MNHPFETLEPAIDPANRISFLLDWELTMKCNLDCDYCTTGLTGGHDNSLPHPDVEQCLKAIDFMFAYVNLYMLTKPKGIRYVILNVYGGESLYHPDIEHILNQVREKYQPYQDQWHLTVTTTTNAIVSEKQLEKIIPLVDEFTVSYHSGASEKQKNQFRSNLLKIKQSGRRQKCIVLMHSTPELFEDSQQIIAWLKNNNINYLPKQLDYNTRTDLNYNSNQVTWFGNFYNSKNYKTSTDLSTIDNHADNHSLSHVGRACCGGRQLCTNSNYKTREFFVANKFPDWYCSVNYFFLFVKQVNGEIYVNKDCKMNFNHTVAPIGNLSNSQNLLDITKKHLESGTLPIIQCKKSKCHCGLCAPKAKDLNSYNHIMKKYQKEKL